MCTVTSASAEASGSATASVATSVASTSCLTTGRTLTGALRQRRAATAASRTRVSAPPPAASWTELEPLMEPAGGGLVKSKGMVPVGVAKKTLRETGAGLRPLLSHWVKPLVAALQLLV